MKIRQLLLIATAALLVAPAAGVRAEDAPSCPSPPAPLPAALSAWTAPAPIVAAQGPSALPSAVLTVGHAYVASLHPTKTVQYSVAPDRPGGSASFGGTFQFDVKEAGVYRVAQSSGAWIDVVEGTALVLSASHSHGPACSGIHKMVDFALKPGPHVLQISANGEQTLTILIVKQPH